MATNPQSQPEDDPTTNYFFLLLQSSSSYSAVLGNPIPVSQAVAEMFINQKLNTPPESSNNTSICHKPLVVRSLDTEDSIRQFVCSLISKNKATEFPFQIPQRNQENCELEDTGTSSSSPHESIKSYLPFTPACSQKQLNSKIANEEHHVEDSQDESEDELECETNVMGKVRFSELNSVKIIEPTVEENEGELTDEDDDEQMGGRSDLVQRKKPHACKRPRYDRCRLDERIEKCNWSSSRKGSRKRC